MASLWARVENEYPEAAILTRVTAAAAVSGNVTFSRKGGLCVCMYMEVEITVGHWSISEHSTRMADTWSVIVSRRLIVASYANFLSTST